MMGRGARLLIKEGLNYKGGQDAQPEERKGPSRRERKNGNLRLRWRLERWNGSERTEIVKRKALNRKGGRREGEGEDHCESSW